MFGKGGYGPEMGQNLLYNLGYLGDQGTMIAKAPLTYR